MLWIILKHLVVGIFEKCCWKWSGISVESCTRSRNQGIPGQPGAITLMSQLSCLIFGSPYEGEPWEGKHKQ